MLRASGRTSLASRGIEKVTDPVAGLRNSWARSRRCRRAATLAADDRREVLALVDRCSATVTTKSAVDRSVLDESGSECDRRRQGAVGGDVEVLEQRVMSSSRGLDTVQGARATNDVLMRPTTRAIHGIDHSIRRS